MQLSRSSDLLQQQVVRLNDSGQQGVQGSNNGGRPRVQLSIPGLPFSMDGALNNSQFTTNAGLYSLDEVRGSAKLKNESASSLAPVPPGLP